MEAPGQLPSLPPPLLNPALGQSVMSAAASLCPAVRTVLTSSSFATVPTLRRR